MLRLTPERVETNSCMTASNSCWQPQQWREQVLSWDMTGLMTCPCAVSKAQISCPYYCFANITRGKLFPKHAASSDGILHPCDAAPIFAKAACIHVYSFGADLHLTLGKQQ